VTSDLMVWVAQHLAECLTASSDDHFKGLKSEATSSERNRYGPEGQNRTTRFILFKDL